MRVLFLTNIPSPYRVDFFNELGKLCELTVLFESKGARDRDDSWQKNEFNEFTGIFLRGIKLGTAEAVCTGVIRYLSKKAFDIIVVGMYSSPTGMLAIEYMKMKKIPFILSTDGGMIKQEKKLVYKMKKHFISSASAWLSTGKLTTDYLEYYGADRNKCHVYPFTSVKSSDVLKKQLSIEEKLEIKQKLGVKEELVILSVGQFIHRKGYDVLLKACKNMNEYVGVYLIGGNATEEYLDIMKKYNLKNIYFKEFMRKEELEQYYLAADIFVLPTREDIWGLVINEAMSYGLPVITTEKCVAGVEIVGNGVAGEIIESENIEALRDAISKLIENRKLISKYGDNSREKIKFYTIENMAKKHKKIFDNYRKVGDDN